MTLTPTTTDVALRLVLTMVAAGVIGMDRSRRGHVAGFRTTILVSLAACVAMLQANTLLATDGKTAGAFASMDVMRLPLGILTGVGFIGGGAILKRGDLVLGVTTAATLWMVTVIGLCMGAGDIGLGSAAAVLSVVTLWGLQWLERRLPRRRRGFLELAEDVDCRELASSLKPIVVEVRLLRAQHNGPGGPPRAAYELRWNATEEDDTPAALLGRLRTRGTMLSFRLPSELSE